MRDKGFLIKTDRVTNADDEGTTLTRQVRGSAFRHTAVRENHMLARLNATLGPRGVVAANEAMGVYVYGPPNQPFGPDVSVPACAVTHTKGDRRLGTHILAGESGCLVPVQSSSYPSCFLFAHVVANIARSFLVVAVVSVDRK